MEKLQEIYFVESYKVYLNFYNRINVIWNEKHSEISQGYILFRLFSIFSENQF